MKYSQTQGIVLRVLDYGESDKLISFFSPDLGRFTGIAKGAKRSKKRFLNKLELFSLLQVIYGDKRTGSIIFIKDAELINAFLSIRFHFSRYAVAVFFSELLLRFTREQDSEPRLYQLLTWALNALDQSYPPLQVAALFHLKLLGIVGYRPSLSFCVVCRKQAEVNDVFTFHHATGSIVCRNCFSKQRQNWNDMPSLSLQTLKFLQKAQEVTTLSRMDRLQLPGKAVKETLLFLYHYSRQILQQDISSWSTVKSLLQSAYR